MSYFLKIKIVGSVLSDIWQLCAVSAKDEKFWFMLNQHFQEKNPLFQLGYKAFMRRAIKYNLSGKRLFKKKVSQKETNLSKLC